MLIGLATTPAGFGASPKRLHDLEFLSSILFIFIEVIIMNEWIEKVSKGKNNSEEIAFIASNVASLFAITFPRLIK